MEWFTDSIGSTPWKTDNLQTIREGYLEWKKKYLIAKDKLEKGIINIYDPIYGFLVKQYNPEEDKENEKAITMFNFYASLMKQYNIIPYPNIKPEYISPKKGKNEKNKTK